MPTYGFLDQYLGRGIVGGSLYSSNTQGNEAAKLVLQTLAPSERSRLPLSEVAGNKLLFDWRQMQRWSISERRLPSESEIRFRELTIWQQYFWQMVAIFVALGTAVTCAGSLRRL